MDYHQPLNYLNGSFLFGNNSDNCLGDLPSGRGMKPDPGLEDGWILNYVNGWNSGTSNHIPRTASFPLEVAVAMAANKGETASSDVSSVIGNESFKKRKAEQVEKKTESTDEGSRITEDNTRSNKKRKVSDDYPKLDYIHVRARRGQATDSHSLAERVRREKISERMKYLQDLVPGCNKITGKAGMLDEIINYVQSLQRQVEFLSMKLANVNPYPDHFEVDNYLPKEMLPMCTSSMVDDTQLQFDALTQGTSCSSIGVNSALRRTTSEPVYIQDSLLDSSCFNQQIQHLTSWDTELQNLFAMEYLQGKSSFISQAFTGHSETAHVKMEM